MIASVGLLFVGCLRLSDVAQRRPVEPSPTFITVDRLIRVRLGGRTPRESAMLEMSASFRVEDLGTGRILSRRHVACGPVKVTAPRGGGVAIGAEQFSSDDIMISPERDAAIVLGKRTYRGSLRIRRVDGGLVFDNHVDVESYLRGVLRGELPHNFHTESFRAQAVAARTYVLYQKQLAAARRSFDVYDNEGSQMYIGVAGEDRIAVEAVRYTRGEVCVWDDGSGERLFCTYYSSTCGGTTQNVSHFKPSEPFVGPLSGEVSCKDCSLAKFYRWGPVKISKAEVSRKVIARYPSLANLGIITGISPKTRSNDGRIIHLKLTGSTGRSGVLVGEDFRLSVGGRVLKSSNFDIQESRQDFIFKNGKGFGHGVGLCQHGMETKARRGMTYEQILTTYYPGSEIKQLYR